MLLQQPDRYGDICVRTDRDDIRTMTSIARTSFSASEYV